MNLRFSPEDEAFRQQVRHWLRDNLREFGFAEGDWRARREAPAVFRWERHLARSGWTGLSWPREYGGRALPLVRQVIFLEEYAAADAPQLYNSMAHGILAPTLIHWGTEAQKRRFLPPILSNEERWCQGYSEPGAGSDLAALATRAVRVSDARGDRYVVNGQKVWTSLAHLADWCFLLVRTDAAVPRHQGISFLLMDMKSKGVTVRPLRQMTGESEFNEVFLDDVEIPVANRVGEENQGWDIAMTAANHERGTFFIPAIAALRRELRDLVALARERDALKDALVRDRLTQAFIDVRLMLLTAYRTVSLLMQGQPPGAEASFTKLVWSETRQRMTELAVELLGEQAQLHWEDAGFGAPARWQREQLWARAQTILAATSQIHRNIIAERALGLPR